MTAANVIDATVTFQRQRLLAVLGRHVRKEDQDMPDAAFVRAVFDRFEYERTQPLIDPAE